MKAISAMRTDSLRNWIITWLRRAPIVFRSDISRARTMAVAVARFVKLKQAMSRINTPIAMKP